MLMEQQACESVNTRVVPSTALYDTAHLSGGSSNT
jgi:hypothetical protein